MQLVEIAVTGSLVHRCQGRHSDSIADRFQHIIAQMSEGLNARMAGLEDFACQPCMDMLQFDSHYPASQLCHCQMVFFSESQYRR